MHVSCSGPEAEACSALRHGEHLQRVLQEVGLGAGLGEGAEQSQNMARHSRWGCRTLNHSSPGFWPSLGQELWFSGLAGYLSGWLLGQGEHALCTAGPGCLGTGLWLGSG